MAITIYWSEPLVDSLVPEWTGDELWRASVETGPFTLVVQLPYVVGQTDYSYVDTAGTSASWYELRRYGPGPIYSAFSPPWTITGHPFARRSLGNIRRMLAHELQSLTLVTTTGSSSNSIISTDLAGGLDSNTFRSGWVMPTTDGADPGSSANVVRRVGEKALNTSTGELVLTTALPTALPSGTKVEIHIELPPVNHGRMRGLRACINEALAEMWMPVRLPLVGVNGQPEYDLSAYADWLSGDAIREVYGPPADSTTVATPWPGFAVVQNAEALAVDVSPTLSTGAAALVGAFRPGDTYIRSGGAWGSSTTGLVYDTDETVFQPDLVVQIALQHAYDALANTGEQVERARWQTLADRQLIRANLLKLYYLPHEQRRTAHAGQRDYDPKRFETW